MKKIIILLLLSLFLFACSDDDEYKYIVQPLESYTSENSYYNPYAVEQFLFKMVNRYGELVSLRQIGFSSGSPALPIYALKITDNPAVAENEPELLFAGAMHGNEQISCGIILKFVEDILQGYSNSSVIKNIVDNNELHFIPVINPYGLLKDSRYNANGVDLNRNFGWAWIAGVNRGSSAFDQPESLALKQDAEAHQYMFSLNGHTGATCLSVLWDYIGSTSSLGTPATYTIEQFTNSFLPVYPLVEEISSNYEFSVNNNGDPSFYWIEGYDWYEVFGSMQDWFYGVRGAISFTAEYSYVYGNPDDGGVLLNDVWLKHKDALYSMFDICEQGIKGIVTDFTTGLPVSAKIILSKGGSKAVADPVDFNTFGFADPALGDYHIAIQGGVFQVSVEADGYAFFVTNNIIVPEGGLLTLDIKLVQSKFNPVYDKVKLPDMTGISSPDLRNE